MVTHDRRGGIREDPDVDAPVLPRADDERIVGERHGDRAVGGSNVQRIAFGLVDGAADLLGLRRGGGNRKYRRKNGAGQDRIVFMSDLPTDNAGVGSYTGREHIAQAGETEPRLEYQQVRDLRRSTELHGPLPAAGTVRWGFSLHN